jgi:hypothetical protein
MSLCGLYAPFVKAPPPQPLLMGERSPVTPTPSALRRLIAWARRHWHKEVSDGLA